MKTFKEFLKEDKQLKEDSHGTLKKEVEKNTLTYVTSIDFSKNDGQKLYKKWIEDGKKVLKDFINNPEDGKYVCWTLKKLNSNWINDYPLMIDTSYNFGIYKDRGFVAGYAFDNHHETKRYRPTQNKSIVEKYIDKIFDAFKNHIFH